MLSKDLENTLNLLFKECSDNNDEFVTIEHLLLVLTQEDSSRKVLDHLSIDIDSLQKEIKEYIKKNVPKACLLYTSPSPRDGLLSRMPSSA